MELYKPENSETWALDLNSCTFYVDRYRYEEGYADQYLWLYRTDLTSKGQNLSGGLSGDDAKQALQLMIDNEVPEYK